MKTTANETQGAQAATLTGQEGEDERRRAARRERLRTAIRPTPEEDAVVTAAALTDPDNPPMTDAELARLKPARRTPGRPVQEAIKVPTTMRLDVDVLDSFKATGAGWQGRVNAALRDFLASRNMMAHRYHATVHREAEQLGEFLVVAADPGQAKEKVRQHLRQLGNEEGARGQVHTVEVGNARMAHLDVVY